MINFKQRVQIATRYQEWLAFKNIDLEERETGYRLKDTKETFLVYLSEKCLLDEEAIDKKYPKYI